MAQLSNAYLKQHFKHCDGSRNVTHNCWIYLFFWWKCILVKGMAENDNYLTCALLPGRGGTLSSLHMKKQFVTLLDCLTKPNAILPCVNHQGHKGGYQNQGKITAFKGPKSLADQLVEGGVFRISH